MAELRTVSLMLAIFLTVQFLGLYVGAQYIDLARQGQAELIFENPENIENSAILIVYILAMTAVLILLIKYWIFFIKIIEAFAIFFTSLITFTILVPVWYFPFVLAGALTAWKMLRPSILSQNAAIMLSTAGAGAIIGASLGITPILLFILFLSIYDFVSVFITKHMVYMAKAITKQPTAFTAAVPHKFKKPTTTFAIPGKPVKQRIHVFQLGGGDLAIPLTFSISVLSAYALTNALFVTAGSAIALLLLIMFAIKRPGRALPALPPICAGGCIGFALSLLLI